MMVMVRLPEGLSAQAAQRTPVSDAPLFMLSVYGADHPGIVAHVARAVADHGGNITDMNTRVIGSEDRPVYVMILEIQLPEQVGPTELEQALEQLKPALGVDLTFRPIEQVRL